MSIARQRRPGRRIEIGRGDLVEWTLEPADSAAVRRLRRQILQTLRRIATPESDLAAAEVVIAELLTNAHRHASGPAWVTLRWDGQHPLFSVADAGPGFTLAEPPRLPADPLAERGRGLYLAAHLALDIAVAARSTGGTVVSVTLDLQRAS